jgi:hypothetical protein
MDSRLTRRRLLAAGAVTSTTAFAGCSGVLGGSPDPSPEPIHSLLVENWTASEHTVHLQLLDAGELSYWRSVDVPVTDSDSETITGVKYSPGFPRPPGEYAVRARLDDHTDWKRSDFTDVSVPEEACFEISVQVLDGETLQFMKTTDAAACE